MARLPVIVGFGGVNSAGRMSCHHAYRRLVIDALGPGEKDGTFAALAALMNLKGDPTDGELRRYMLDHTLIRRIDLFDPDNIPWQRSARLFHEGRDLEFSMPRRHLPEDLPDGWTITREEGRDVSLRVSGPMRTMLPAARASRVSAAAQVPSGFDPGALYQSRNHPRGLQLAVFGASDAVRSTGIDFRALRERLGPGEFAVYSASAMGQLDEDGTGGMLQARLLGRRVSSKQLALGLCEMPADFINAYVVGTMGSTGGTVGACATFLYNVRQAVEDIASGRHRVAIVGNSEAPITPEVVEGYRIMGALAEDEALMALDGRTDQPDYRRACRPFAENCGFTVAEAAAYVVLMDDELALELGAGILGSIPGVFVHADGYKKSIAGPGVGNYLTVARAMGLARAILGEEGLRNRTYVQAHGTGTPQNRVTESHILDTLARTFGIPRWTVGAVKAYLGHSLAPAGGDQLAASLGAWAHGWIPGITTIDAVAEDVHAGHLHFPLGHVAIDPESMDGVLINSKGFGGNNATGLVLSPAQTRRMLERKHGSRAVNEARLLGESVQARIDEYDARAGRGELEPIYQFGEGVLGGEDLEITTEEIRVPGYGQPVSLSRPNPFADYTD